MDTIAPSAVMALEVGDLVGDNLQIVVALLAGGHVVVILEVFGVLSILGVRSDVRQQELAQEGASIDLVYEGLHNVVRGAEHGIVLYELPVDLDGQVE